MSRLFGREAPAGVITPRSPTGRSAPGKPEAPRRRSGLARLVGGSGMLLLTIALLWLLTDDSFRVTASNITVEGIVYADDAAVLGQLQGLDRAPNVFRVRASDFVAEMHRLPQVLSASAVVTIPAQVSVRIREREPHFTWSDGADSWLVDGSGVLFARAPADRAALPIVEDRRLVSEPPSVGSELPDIDLAVMEQLLALTPELLGSRSVMLELSIDQFDGYVLRSELGWQAVFGHYSPSLQPPTVVPRQVQCLTWLLASRENRLERVRLAVSPETCGTFTRFGSRN